MIVQGHPKWGTLSPRPPGIFRISSCSSREGGKEEPGERPKKSARPSAVGKAPVGARVASPQSPILRWSKELFPVSVSLGVYRAGKGKGEIELIAFGVAAQFSLLSQLF